MVYLKVEKHLLAALTVFVVLSVAFIQIALAYDQYDDDTSADGHAYAYVKGWYYEIFTTYYMTYHYGEVDEDAQPESWTSFEGKLNDSRVYYDRYFLSQPGSEDQTYNEEVNLAQTITDAKNKYIEDAGVATATIGPPGMVP